MMNMNFKEFNEKVEKPIYESIMEVLMQPRRVLSIREKLADIGNVIGAYNNAYKEITGQDIEIDELIGEMKDDR